MVKKLGHVIFCGDPQCGHFKARGTRTLKTTNTRFLKEGQLCEDKSWEAPCVTQSIKVPGRPLGVCGPWGLGFRIARMVMVPVSCSALLSYSFL